jgi:outer membrane protein insertion porin family
VDLYRHQLDFESPNDLFNETRTGVRIGLSRDLYEVGQHQIKGGISYSLEDVGIQLNHQTNTVVPNSISNEVGDHIFHRFGASLVYDSRNSVKLPNHGQRTEFNPEIDIGARDYYKLEMTTAWYFPGIFHHNVLEIGGRAAVAQSLDSGDVPFYDRYYLGGMYSLRGFKYRNISPREPGSPEPIGGDTYWFASAEYSIPIFEKDNGPSVRLAAFYDIGQVGTHPFALDGENFDDNWGFGLRLDIPHLGPLRLDYGIPIHHDKYNGDSGQFQFGVNYTRPF